jgi:RNA polymerase sigma factor (sigma-70 family)
LTTTNEELCLRIRQGEPQLLPQLWEQQESLIYWRAYRYYNSRRGVCDASGVTVEDLKQEGFFAVTDAVKAYDPDTGYKFTAYLNFPLKNRFKAVTGVKEHSRVEPLNRCTSLDAPLSEDNDASLADTVPDENAVRPFEAVEDNIVNDQLKAVFEDCLSSLPETERRVLRLRYYQNLSQTAAGAVLGISNDRVRDLQNKALRTLRRSAYYKRIKAAAELDIIETVSYNASKRGCFVGRVNQHGSVGGDCSPRRADVIADKYGRHGEYAAAYRQENDVYFSPPHLKNPPFLLEYNDCTTHLL